jgi:hypothetical protein
MACSVPTPVEIEVSLNTANQTREQVIAIVERILGANGAMECGIMARFSVTLANRSERTQDTNPGPELAKLGVTSLEKTAVR